ncbi:hypothetical protein SCL_1613 [Sulfuricaulis limicola]|uniref:Uncharacterized protein n=1 Tax=Sulfuricaulis limicola TaxID=1620215 RepID=A0A1B4XGI2_9GAMM|nr:hypothetical protein [Sulfuricaulis limicola]BAV33918.1 hypothetical protein SCL_1613 [Sulfuricaulis limicola]
MKNATVRALREHKQLFELKHAERKQLKFLPGTRKYPQFLDKDPEWTLELVVKAVWPEVGRISFNPATAGGRDEKHNTENYTKRAVGGPGWNLLGGQYFVSHLKPL